MSEIPIIKIQTDKGLVDAILVEDIPKFIEIQNESKQLSYIG